MYQLVFHLFLRFLPAEWANRLGHLALRLLVVVPPLGALFARAEGAPLHVAGHLRRSVWQGRESVELMIEDAAAPCGDEA